MKQFILASVLAITATFAYPAHTTYTAPEVQQPEVKQSESLTLPYQLKRICSCESTGSPNNVPIHFNADGSVLRGKVNPADVGQCQINLFYHGDRATSLGIDLFSEEGNKRYAVLLYQEQGTKPWSWSSKCWGIDKP